MWAQGHSRYLGTRVQRHLSLQAYMCVGMQGKWALHKHIGMQTTLPCRRVTTQVRRQVGHVGRDQIFSRRQI